MRIDENTLYVEAAAVLDDDAALICDLETYDPRGHHVTIIEFRRGTVRRRTDDRRPEHVLRVTYAGKPNAATIGWFASQAPRFALTACIEGIAGDDDWRKPHRAARKPRRIASRK